MTIGDIVIVTILRGSYNRAIDKDEIIEVTELMAKTKRYGWVTKENLEQVNCSIGRQWPIVENCRCVLHGCLERTEGPQL